MTAAYAGPDRRGGDGDLTVGERISRLEAKVDTLTSRVTWLMGGLAAIGGALAIAEVLAQAGVIHT